MEEVDKIIIYTLKSLNCDIDEEVTSVKGLTTEIFVEAVVKMIGIIDPTFQTSKIMPNSMSAKYKYCAELSDKVKQVGFQGDLGYQTFLYGNEIEVRRTLMFLIERLPREQTKQSVHTETKLDAFKQKLSKAILEDMNSHRSNLFLSVPLETGIVLPGKRKNEMSPREWRQFCIEELKFITEQADPKYILPSLITLNAYDGVEPKDPPKFPIIDEEKDDYINVPNEIETNYSTTIDISENDLKKLSQTLDLELEKLSKLKQDFKQSEKLKKDEELELNKKRKDVDINEKLIIMLPEADEYVEKLEAKISGAQDKMEQLQEKWKELKRPYEEENNKTPKQQSESSQYYERLKQLREVAQGLKKEYEIKTNALKKLNENLPKKCANRSSYTKRILEIINNIKKQESDITKIITDTKQIQKQLNNVNGKIERCFTLADEMIFRDASRDDTARKAYKHLVTLHTDCSDIVKIVTEMGNLKKEMKNIEEQIDALCSKNIGDNLFQIQKDIQHMRNESSVIVQQLEGFE